jgi:chromosomal replication initiator protein
LSESAASALAAEIRDLRELEGLVRRLDAETPGRRRCGRKVTVARVRRLLDEAAEEPLSVAAVAAQVCDYYEVPLGRVRSASRVQEVVQVRQLAMYLTRTLTDASLVEVGRFFGGRDHSTVLHSCERAEELLASDARFGRAVRDIRRLLRDGDG